jgi:hypothetical protein
MTTLVSLTYEYEETTGKLLKLTFSGASEKSERASAVGYITSYAINCDAQYFPLSNDCAHVQGVDSVPSTY